MGNHVLGMIYDKNVTSSLDEKKEEVVSLCGVPSL